MAGSFSAALSGSNANSIALSVIGNNLANTNTIGFKASTVTFHDPVSQTLKLGGGGGNPVQIGLGDHRDDLTCLQPGLDRINAGADQRRHPG